LIQAVFGVNTVMRILIFLLVCSVFATAQAKTSLGLNDVSVLIPLPRLEDDAKYLLRPQDGLVPDAVLKELGPLITDDNSVDRSKSLKTVAFRIDPCFTEDTGPVACRRQLRLVFQPMSYYQNGAMVFDAAVHAFYEFDDRSWTALLKDWAQTVTDKSAKQTLQVHPVLKAEGLKGPQWQKYRNILTKYCSEQNLVRVTQSTVDRFGMNWEFSGVDIDTHGHTARINIPRVNADKQIFFSNPGDLKEFTAEIAPAPQGEEDLVDFLSGSGFKKETTQWKAVRKAMEFENPQRFNTANLDCVSCHMAQGVRLWGEAHFNAWASDKEVRKARFTSARNLEQSEKPFAYTNRVRAFGYFFDEANISPRVINESAQVADALEKILN
jgi:hypothetical protein